MITNQASLVKSWFKAKLLTVFIVMLLKYTIFNKDVPAGEDQYCEMDLCETDEWFSGAGTLTISSLLVALITALAL